MKPTADTAIHLLHGVTSGTLATHSLQMPGYPFASALPFVPDERHCPVFLVSGLAEHTRNLAADGRASFLVSGPDCGNVLAGARMTLAGDAARIEPSPELIARYLRYQPDAENFMSLGDFAFYRLAPKRVRYIAGFGHMGWLEENDWAGAPELSPADETRLLRQLAGDQRAGVRLLGVDCHGCDIEQAGKRQRLRFGGASVPDNMYESVRRLLATL